MEEKVRIGYACVNMTLTNRPKKLGGRVTTSRTARKATWYPDNLSILSERALANAKDLLHYLKWNEENKIRLFRIGSELFPWHDQYELHQLPDYEEISEALRAAGDYAREHKHRLTTHPGPFHVLGSPTMDVVDRSIISLERHSQLFDLLGYTPSYDNKINIHIAGAYGDRESTAKRWINGYNRLSDECRARLVVENDDKPSLYSVKQLYELFHQKIGIPITFDYFHHTFHTDELTEHEALEMAGSTWPSDVVQCCHYSESRRIEKKNYLAEVCGKHNIEWDQIDEWPTFAKYKKEFSKIREQAHADYVLDTIENYGHRIDVVLEAKAKELAVFKYRDIYTKKKRKISYER
tara:strand:+ start:1626 stop:2678 length:1053 start_codon:yes stop_codon:yes gene_type:complete